MIYFWLTRIPKELRSWQKKLRPRLFIKITRRLLKNLQI